MKAILFFSFIFLLFLSGCGQQPEPRIKYIKGNCPKLTILHPIPKKDFPPEVHLKIVPDGKYYKVEKNALKKASEVSQKKSILIKKQTRYIRFYEKEIRMMREICKKP